MFVLSYAEHMVEGRRNSLPSEWILVACIDSGTVCHLHLCPGFNMFHYSIGNGHNFSASSIDFSAATDSTYFCMLCRFCNLTDSS